MDSPTLFVVKFKTLDSTNTFQIEIPFSDNTTIYELKNHIEKIYPEYSADKIRLFYDGVILENDCSIFSYGIFTSYDKDKYVVLQDLIIREKVKDPKIKGLIWNNSKRETGELYYGIGITSVTNRRIGFRNAIKDCIINIVQDLYKILHLGEIEREDYIKKHAQKYIQIGSFSNISRIQPKLRDSCIHKIRNMMVKFTVSSVIKFINENLEKIDDKLESFNTSDSDFLAYLQNKRNYKENCAICLTDEIMGTTCECGHTEIVIFRPCGHSVCCSPCFYDICASKKIELKHDGEYTNRTIKNIDTASNFECLLCRRNVERCFRAERITVSENWSDEIDKLTELSLDFSYGFC